LRGRMPRRGHPAGTMNPDCQRRRRHGQERVVPYTPTPSQNPRNVTHVPPLPLPARARPKVAGFVFVWAIGYWLSTVGWLGDFGWAKMLTLPPHILSTL
jgi:hypothetical protein